VALDSNGTQTVVVKGGGNGFILETGTIDLKLGGNTIVDVYNNYIDIWPLYAGSLNATITGLKSADLVAFELPQSNYTIQQTTDAAGDKITKIVGSANGGYFASVTMNGWHDAVTFSGDPSIHYI